MYCDQTTDGGGWTVFQKRLDGSVDFFGSWRYYERGFGNLNGEFWLGLDKIHRLTKEPSRLRVDLEDFDSQTAYAQYDLFGVAEERDNYRMSHLGAYTGKASVFIHLEQYHPYIRDKYKKNIYSIKGLKTSTSKLLTPITTCLV